MSQGAPKRETAISDKTTGKAIRATLALLYFGVAAGFGLSATIHGSLALLAVSCVWTALGVAVQCLGD